jgi:repressor LexA
VSIGEQIKKQRLLLGLSQDELAARVGYKDRSTIAKIESGVIDLTHSKLIKIAQSLNVNIEYIIGLAQNKNHSTIKTIPILTAIVAGLPTISEQYIDDYISVPQDWDVDFAFRNKGNSMINARIKDGDIVLCKGQTYANDKQIAICLVNGEEAKLSRIRHFADVLVLKSENDEYKDMVFKAQETDLVKIVGICNFVFMNVK